jgi:hypothetical protein
MLACFDNDIVVVHHGRALRRCLAMRNLFVRPDTKHNEGIQEWLYHNSGIDVI